MDEQVTTERFPTVVKESFSHTSQVDTTRLKPMRWSLRFYFLLLY